VVDAETMPSTTPASPSAAQLQFDSLTSLRFVAAMSVVVYHYFSLSAFSSPGTVSATTLDPISRGLGTYVFALSNGHLAVGFFFMLSGFVLAHAHFQQMRDRSFDYVPFLKRRFSRIYPLHFIVTLACGGLFLLARGLGIAVNNSENFTWAAFLSNIFLIRGLNLIGRLTFNGPAWFVSSQWHLYMLFPVLAYFVLRSPLKSVGTLCVAVAFFLGLYYFVPGDELLTQRTYDFGILRAIAEFPIGLAMYRVSQDYQRSGATFIRPLHVLVVGIAVFAAAQIDLADSVIALLLAALIFTAAAAELHHSMRWLANPWLIYGGKISYAIYLIHVPFLACARKTFPLIGATPASLAEGILLVACVALLLPTSAFVYRWIELPANKWTQNLLSGSPRPTLAAA
jgi:peptidoglycan/LPS O-acetylase OafA/YrhL